MTELEPVLAGTIVARPPTLSVRDVDSSRWGDPEWLHLAVDIWLDAQRSNHTKAAYRRDFGYWTAWCIQNGVPVNDARRADVDKWWNEGMPGLSPASVCRRISTISSFYKYWASEDVVPRNPAADINRPGVSSAPVSIALSKPQAALLVGYTDSLADPRPGVITRLLAQTGMRVGELTAAEVPDLAMSGGHNLVELTRKGGKRQQVVVLPNTYERTMEYLGGRATGYILYVAPTERRRGDGQMDRSYVRQLLIRIAREAGLPAEVWRRMHPHVLRHSVATLLAADGVPVHEIQQLLGHASLQTTERYIHHAQTLDNSPAYRMQKILAG